VDTQGNLWVTDARSNDEIGHQVFKFSPDGEILMTLGQRGVGGSGRNLLHNPNDVVIDPSDGDIFVADSHRGGLNNRIVHFTAEGSYIKEWGSKGSASGPDTGAGELMGIMKGIRVGSAVDGSVTNFIEDMEPLRDDHSGAEGVGVDKDGNVYGAVVRRRMLERHVLR